jgi:hypothetical protein
VQRLRGRKELSGSKYSKEVRAAIGSSEARETVVSQPYGTLKVWVWDLSGGGSEVTSLPQGSSCYLCHQLPVASHFFVVISTSLIICRDCESLKGHLPALPPILLQMPRY